MNGYPIHAGGILHAVRTLDEHFKQATKSPTNLVIIPTELKLVYCTIITPQDMEHGNIEMLERGLLNPMIERNADKGALHLTHVVGYVDDEFNQLTTRTIKKFGTLVNANLNWKREG